MVLIGNTGSEWFGRGRLLRAALIVAAGLWVFSPAFHGDWLWDDDSNIAFNSQVHDPAGWKKIWLSTETDGMGYYYPFELLVQWIQWQLWDGNTFGYHLTNVGLHLAGAFLLWRLLHRLGLREAWLGAMIFTVHPVTVESVAWISELKNTLSLPPLLLAMLAYLAYDREQRR